MGDLQGKKTKTSARPVTLGKGPEVAAKTMVRAMIAEVLAKAREAKDLELRELWLGGSTSPWANGGSSAVTRHVRAVEEEGTHSTPSGLYWHRDIPKMYRNRQGEEL